MAYFTLPLVAVLFSAVYAICVQHDAYLGNSSISFPNACNTFDPNCGLTPAEAQARFLTPYRQLTKVLRRIKRNSKVPIALGPLIRNDNSGLIDIDIPLDKKLSPVVKTDVCGESNPSPTVREAVICTVSKDKLLQPPRGNIEPRKIGKSTQGRTLLGVRLGNPKGTRVFVVSQQHGNEAAPTEAVLSVLRSLTCETPFAKTILSKLDLLFLVRANPDGGEPNTNDNPPFGKNYTESTGFFRHNVDPSAGGGFTGPTEPGFFGVVGRGYNINRYNYASLYAAIRPVESQAMMAVLHSFRPEVVLDLHGDMQKVQCELDVDSLVPGGIAGLLPSIECLPPAAPVPTLRTERKSMVLGGLLANDASALGGNWSSSLKSGPLFERNKLLVRSMVAEVVKKVDPSIVGSLSRFSQIQVPGAGQLVDETSGLIGSLDIAAITLSGVGIGWEVVNFATAMRSVVVGLNDTDGMLAPITGLDTAFSEPCFLRDNICIHKRFLRQILLATVKFVGKPLSGDNGYCSIPLNTGQVIRLPRSLGFPPESAIEVDVMSPGGGLFGAPALIAGSCPGDPPSLL